MIVGLIVALQFLTRLPINISVDFNENTIGKATFFFPYVGMILGLISYLPYLLLYKYNIEIASFLVVIFMIVLTGGLHLDGLSDMADGFFSSRDRLRMLEIMSDSRIGAFGVISLIIIILFKYIVISNISPENIFCVLVFSMGNGRLMALIQIAYGKMIKAGGMGDMIHSSNNKKYIKLAILSYILINILINYRFIYPILASLFMAILISKLSYKKIGGFTGDLYGATVELCEAVSLLFFLGVLEWI